MFAVIGSWEVEGALESAQLEHIATNVREQAGFVRGYWGQAPDDVSSAHAVVLLQDEGSARAMAEGVRSAIPSASVRVIRVLAEA